MLLEHCEFVSFFALVVADVSSNMMKSSKNLIHDWDQPNQSYKHSKSFWILKNSQKVLLIASWIQFMDSKFWITLVQVKKYCKYFSFFQISVQYMNQENVGSWKKIIRLEVLFKKYFVKLLHTWYEYVLDILFSSNHNIHKSSCGHCF